MQKHLRNLGGMLSLLVILCFSIGRSDCSVTQNVVTAKKYGSSLNFLAVGDWGRKGLFNQSQVAAQMGIVGEKLQIDFVISTGDNFYDKGLNGTDDPSFEHSFSQVYTAKSLQKQWYAVLGNHDYMGNALAQFSSSLTRRDRRWYCQRSFRLHYKIHSHSEECALVDFFFFDTSPYINKYWEPSNITNDWRGVLPRARFLQRQLKDLRKALANSNAVWKIVVGHHPIRSIGDDGDTVELVQKLWPILEEFQVDLYVNGHDHNLARITSLTSSLQFLTSGGGSKAWKGMNETPNMKGSQFFYPGQGFMSTQVTKKFLSVDFYDVEGKILHSFNLTK
ncbi:purple acid phosphatase 7-like [Cryptomeria japonica]|uniref:purple acid phosphatase 7-like n=1 Tax=Cryptomeria japonica TaxID=3369 RepID=UPI0027D9D4FF|nr:purple acid phosphatase 7-like [Cryptomeria japonica]